MAPPRLVTTAKAEADLRDIFRQVAADNGLSAATSVLRKLEKALPNLAAFPHLGRATRSGARLHSVKPWIIVYRPITGGVEVLRVLDGRRDLGVLIGKKT